MNNLYQFFENKACKYYPCHSRIQNINCMFCYCPLYHFEECPGNYKFVESNGRRIKGCTDCTFPHEPENYDNIITLVSKNNVYH